MRVVSREEMQALEYRAIKELGLSSLTLMESAGRSVADFVKQKLQTKKDHQNQKIVIMVGPGNNGADGMVAARYLHNVGACVSVVIASKVSELQNESKIQYQALKMCEVPIWEMTENELSTLLHKLSSLSSDDVIVDALFGVGLKRPLQGFFQKCVTSINDSNAFVIAVDIPSGLDANQGVLPETDGGIVKADATVTCAFPKVGMVNSPGFLYVGTLQIADIGIPQSWVNISKQQKQAAHVSYHLLDESCLQPFTEPKHPLSHKGTHGHIGMVAGSLGKIGAGLLAALSATKTGVGLCTLIVPENVLTAVQGRIFEVMTATYQIPSQSEQINQKRTIEQESQKLLAHLQGKQAWVLGPGIPTDPFTRAMLWEVIQQDNTPVVLDADALNAIADASLLQQVSRRRPVVITPHPGEAARLLKTTSDAIQQNRLHNAILLHQITGAIVVLKGARTLIVTAAPSSEDASAHLEISICPTGNAAMGTGGMGDVLAGMIGALLTQGFPPYQASCMAVYLHGLIADQISSQQAPGVLITASQVANHIPFYRT